MESSRKYFIRKKSFLKSITWRIIAIINSYLILVLAVSSGNLINAGLMNITGFILYYVHEIVWNKKEKK